jgi:hypothetical protein
MVADALGLILALGIAFLLYCLAVRARATAPQVDRRRARHFVEMEYRSSHTCAAGQKPCECRSTEERGSRGFLISRPYFRCVCRRHSSISRPNFRIISRLRSILAFARLRKPEKPWTGYWRA